MSQGNGSGMTGLMRIGVALCPIVLQPRVATAAAVVVGFCVYGAVLYDM